MAKSYRSTKRLMMMKNNDLNVDCVLMGRAAEERKQHTLTFINFHLVGVFGGKNNTRAGHTHTITARYAKKSKRLYRFERRKPSGFFTFVSAVVRGLLRSLLGLLIQKFIQSCSGSLRPATWMSSPPPTAPRGSTLAIRTRAGTLL